MSNHIFFRYFIQSLLVLLSLAASAYAATSPDVEYKDTEANNYLVVFPENSDSVAQIMVNYLNLYSPHLSKSLPTKYWGGHYNNVFMNLHNLESNAMVSLVPIYAEFMGGRSNFSGVDWMQIVAIHEMRHIVQRYNHREGFIPEVAYIFWGETFLAISSVLTEPMWLAEGDAVVLETALTTRGRGRVPIFSMYSRALELDGIRQDYYDNYLGTPHQPVFWADHYPLGYFMTSYLRAIHSNRKFNRFYDDIGNYFVAPSAGWSMWLNFRTKKTKVYQDAMDTYKLLWEKQLEGRSLTESKKVLSESPEWWTNFLNLGEDGGRHYVLHLDRDQRTLLGTIKGGQFDEIAQVPAANAFGFVHSGERDFSLGNGEYCYTQISSHPIWMDEGKGVIRCLDLQKAEERVVAKGRYVSVATRPTGSVDGIPEYVALELNPNHRSEVVLLRKNGDVISKIKVPAGFNLQDPSISKDGIVYASALKGDEFHVIKMDPLSKSFETVFALKQASIRTPKKVEGGILYQTDWDGIDNIYFYRNSDSSHTQLVSSKVGAFLPSIHGENLIWSEYSSKGFRLQQLPLTETGVNAENVQVRRVGLFDEVLAMESKPSVIFADTLKHAKKIEVEGHNTLLHGWMAGPWKLVGFYGDIYTNASFQTITKKALLNTEVTYNPVAKLWGGTGEFAWLGWIPNVYVGARRDYISDYYINWDSEYPFYWRNSYYGRFSVPMYWLHGIKRSTLKFNVNASYEMYDEDIREDYSEVYVDRLRMNYSGEYKFALEKSPNALVRPFGASLKLNFNHTPASDSIDIREFYSTLKFEYQGFHNTDGFKLKTGYYWDNQYNTFRGIRPEFDLKAYNTLYRFDPLGRFGSQSYYHNQYAYGGLFYHTPICDLGFGLIWSGLIYLEKLSLSLGAESIAYYSGRAPFVGDEQLYGPDAQGYETAIGGELNISSFLISNKMIKSSFIFSGYYFPQSSNYTLGINFNLGQF